MNLHKLMKQAQKMQEQMAKTQAELEDKTVEVQAAGGKVTVVANGSGDVVSIKIAKEIVDPEDVEFLEEAVLSGVKQAIAQGKDLAQTEMTKITGGLGIGGAGVLRPPLSGRGPYTAAESRRHNARGSGRWGSGKQNHRIPRR